MLVCLCTAMALCWKAKKKSPKKKTQKEPDGNSYMNMTTFAMNFFLNTTIRGVPDGEDKQTPQARRKKTKPISFLVYFDYVYCHYSSLLSHSFQHVMLMHIFWLSELHWSLCFSSRALYETVFFFGGPFVIAFIIGFQYSRSSMASERRIQTII